MRPKKKPMDPSIAKLMGLGERSVQKSYYPQLQQKIRELEKSQQQYRLLAENISDVIWLVGLDFCIAYISPSIEPLSGYTAEELTGTPFARLLHPEDAKMFSARLKDAIEACTPGKSRAIDQLELRLIHKDGGETWIETRISCVHENKDTGSYLLGSSRDITKRKKAQAEKEEMQQLLLQAQKMESIGTLAGGVAHDFNNLLTVINGYAGLILSKTDDQDPMKKKIQAVAHAGKRAEELTRQLLAFSRKQIYSPAPLNINTTLTSMDQMLRRLIGEDIHVKTILEKEIPLISADQTQIEQIFTNLVVNARDALSQMEDPHFTKKITIETGQVHFTPDYAKKLELEAPGDYVFFSVSDNGAGMAPETQEHIFEPFYTTKSKYKGTGLGLAMIYGIVKQNQGGIRVYSEPGHGALFKIYWPVAKDHQAPRPKTLPVSSQALSGSETILLVEDDTDVLHFASHALRSLGYEIQKAMDGKAALEHFQSCLDKDEGVPDLIITDLIMPRMGGKRFIEAAKQLKPDLKVIYVSGHTDTHIVHNGMLDDGVCFIQKPYSQQEIAKMTRRLLDQPLS